jgi:1-acyl-sn-glycerol-3-phosphate acyltransferase
VSRPQFSPTRLTVSEMVVYHLVRTIAVGLSRLYFPGTVKGRENLPMEGGCIVAPVHRSYVDWLIVARITRARRLRYIVKEEVWKSKLIGRVLEACGCFPVNRSGADREALERCRRVLEDGEVLVMFPEGTRRSGPVVEDLKDGLAYLSLRTGAPIIPVGIGGSERAMPRGSRFPRPRRVNVVIGPPVAVPLSAQKADDDEAAGSADRAAARRRGRVGRAAITEQSLRAAKAVQQAFDVAESSLGN